MKRMLVLILFIAMIMEIKMPVYAKTYNYMFSGVTKSTDITQQQFEQILNTLRGMTNNAVNGDYYFQDTGIRCNSHEEAKALIHAFDDLFLSDDKFCLVYNYYESSDLQMDPNKQTEKQCSYTWTWGDGDYFAPHNIYAAWYTNVDANELIRQHDEARKKIDSILSEAPNDGNEKLKYFNDYLANTITYDHAGYEAGNGKHSAYNGLIEGTCVCSGYTEAFYNLCYYSGIYSACVPCVTEASKDGKVNHIFNAVNLDGKWKKIDVTGNDKDPGITYAYFMRDLNDKWQDIINKPYAIFTGMTD